MSKTDKPSQEWFSYNPDDANLGNLVDWKLSEDDEVGNLVAVDGVSPIDLPSFKNTGVNLDLFGEGVHGNEGGSGAPTENMGEQVESTRVGSGAKDAPANDTEEPVMNMLSMDDEVSRHLLVSQSVGQKLQVRDEALTKPYDFDESSTDPSAKAGPKDVNTNVDASSPVKENLRSGKGSEVPDTSGPIASN